MLTFVLAAAALAAGITGAWSPCGFSMVETLAPAGYAGRLRTTLVACATFTAGALVGGVITFGGLGLLGQWLGAGGTGAAAVAAVIAVAAAIGEARGVRIVPQVRRQVPESWRRVLPVPLAAGLYGVLLGLGFTTFILTFAVWALAAVSVALGDPAARRGARARVRRRPRAAGDRARAGRGDRPRQRRPRGDGRAPGDPARPPRRRRRRARRLRDRDDRRGARERAPRGKAVKSAAIAAPSASGPAAVGAYFAFQRPGPAGAGYLRGPNGTVGLPGRDPSLGAGLVGWRTPESQIVLATPDTLTPVATYTAPGAGPFAFSDLWVVWLVGNAQLVVQPRDASVAPRTIATARPGEQLGRPSITGGAVVFHRAGKTGSSIRLFDLVANRESVVRSERRALLSNPSFDGGRLLYVRSTYTLQELRLGPLTRRSTSRDRALYRTTPTARRDAGHEPGHHRHSAGYKGGKPPPLAPRPPAGVVDTLWTTALGPGAAYVTRLRKKSGVTSATVLSVPR